MQTVSYLRSVRCWILFLMFVSLTALGDASTPIPENAVWIDVRTPQEFSSGHATPAHSIPYDRIEKGVAALKLEKDTPIYLYCAVGGRAGIAKKKLDALGYQIVTNVGGLQQARELLNE